MVLGLALASKRPGETILFLSNCPITNLAISSSKRAREERALAAERRLLALQSASAGLLESFTKWTYLC